MRILVVEDELTSQCLLKGYLEVYGDVDVVRNGKDAITAYQKALDEKRRYDLICLDIMMPEMNGHEVLQAVRAMEQREGFGGKEGAKVIMVTALNDKKHILQAFKDQCEAYIVKPIDQKKLVDQLKTLQLIA